MTTGAPRHHLPTIRTILTRVWWLLFPCFLALTIRLTGARACGDPYDLLPAITGNPKWAWPLATLYLLAHLWMLAVCLLTIDETGTLAPSPRRIARVWRTAIVQVVLMSAVFVLEYSPVSLWRWLGALAGCR